MTTMNTSLATSAMLVSVNVSSWTAKKLARKESDELTEGKQASKRAAQVHKNLLADDERLTRINKYAADIRNWLAFVTVPWSDSGMRIISTKQFMKFKQELDYRKNVFDNLVAEFVQLYPTLISAQAFKLGSMFDRSEYPSPEEVASKFRVSYSFMPVPEVGDFRVDVADEIRAELEAHYEAEYQRRVEEINRGHWERLRGVVQHMSERLGTDENGDKRVFHKQLVDNALEVCDLLKDTNVTNDPELERIRKEFENTIMNVTTEELRKNDDIREDIKAQVDSILDKFTW